MNALVTTALNRWTGAFCRAKWADLQVACKKYPGHRALGQPVE